MLIDHQLQHQAIILYRIGVSILVQLLDQSKLHELINCCSSKSTEAITLIFHIPLTSLYAAW